MSFFEVAFLTNELHLHTTPYATTTPLAGTCNSIDFLLGLDGHFHSIRDESHASNNESVESPHAPISHAHTSLQTLPHSPPYIPGEIDDSLDLPELEDILDELVLLASMGG